MHTKEYEQHFIEDANKKSFAESIRIKEGKTFSLGKKKFPFEGPRKRDGKYDDKQRRNDPRFKANLPGGSMNEYGMIIDYRVNYDKMVDSITIHYAEWSYLQLMSKLHLVSH